ncbi:MAG: hypothetical protein IJ688_08345 [Treponema sp.]|nr:hypothetical protein [Treponema sp.]
MKKQILLPLILTLTFTANALPANDLIYREIKNRWEGEKGIWLHILKTAEYSEDGKTVKITDPDGWWTIEEYNDKGNILRSYSENSDDIYRYDESGRLIFRHFTEADRHDWIEEYKYDEEGRCTYFKTENKKELTWEEVSYNKKKNSSTIKGSDGTNKILKGDAQHIVSSKYDKQNNLIEQTKSNWFNKISKTIWKYDEKNHVIFEGTGKYKKWYEYDSNGFLIKETNTGNYDYLYENNALGLPVHMQEIDKLSPVTIRHSYYDYDERGNLIYSNDTWSSENKYYEYEYYPSGKIKTKKNYLLKIKFDMDKCILTEDSAWDEYGNLTYHMKTDERGYNPQTETREYKYNENGKLIYKNLSSKYQNIEKHLDYNEKGLLVHSKDGKGSGEEWYDYDNNDCLISYKTSWDLEESYEYDSHGNRVYLKRISISYLEPDEVPYGKKTTRREVYEEWSEYNSNNILISYKNSNGEFKQYNNGGKLIYFKNIGTDYEFEGWYTYNSEGKPLTYKNSQGVEGTYTYENGYEHYKANNGNETWKLRDVNGNTIYSESKNGYTFSEYDAKGNITYSFSKRGRDSTTIWYVNVYWDNGKLKSVKRYHMK